ncbi:DUF6691 family protein [Oceanobacter kriegii]|uniref:DUF6691 family protein n=1 Tax=Oceanobacter kriegii TaxID=64972 RepID=UPI0004215DFC|nr:DUF6691 family protein [Oceanobacter kriegii]
MSTSVSESNSSISARYLGSLFSALLAGLLFGIGLLLSGMNNPAKVRGFLDIFGAWQPALMAVMGAAVLVFAIGWRLIGKRQQPLFERQFHTPTMSSINVRLITGAAMFGIGWGMVGLCPGPALVDIATMNGDVLLFVLALLVGNRLAHWLIGPAR